jgi:hypothetical protein
VEDDSRTEDYADANAADLRHQSGSPLHGTHRGEYGRDGSDTRFVPTTGRGRSPQVWET